MAAYVIYIKCKPSVQESEDNQESNQKAAIDTLVVQKAPKDTIEA